MKISEVVSGYQQGKDLADKITSPSRWLDNTKVKQDYQRGQDIAGRILDPKQWFKGGSKAEPAKTTPQIRPKESLQRAGQGQKLYRNDIEILKATHQKIESGEVKTRLDQNSLLKTLEAAYKQQPLNDQQRNLLLQFSKQF
jgi:hypothetical protein